MARLCVMMRKVEGLPLGGFALPVRNLELASSGTRTLVPS